MRYFKISDKSKNQLLLFNLKNILIIVTEMNKEKIIIRQMNNDDIEGIFELEKL